MQSLDFVAMVTVHTYSTCSSPPCNSSYNPPQDYHTFFSPHYQFSLYNPWHVFKQVTNVLHCFTIHTMFSYIHWLCLGFRRRSGSLTYRQPHCLGGQGLLGPGINVADSASRVMLTLTLHSLEAHGYTHCTTWCWGLTGPTGLPVSLSASW